MEEARSVRLSETNRFVAECELERRRIAEERLAAWQSADESKAAASNARAQVAELEARASSALRAAADAGDKAHAATEEVDAFYTQIAAYASPM